MTADDGSGKKKIRESWKRTGQVKVPELLFFSYGIIAVKNRKIRTKYTMKVSL